MSDNKFILGTIGLLIVGIIAIVYFGLHVLPKDNFQDTELKQTCLDSNFNGDYAWKQDYCAKLFNP